MYLTPLGLFLSCHVYIFNSPSPSLMHNVYLQAILTLLIVTNIMWWLDSTKQWYYKLETPTLLDIYSINHKFWNVDTFFNVECILVWNMDYDNNFW